MPPKIQPRQPSQRKAKSSSTEDLQHASMAKEPTEAVNDSQAMPSSSKGTEEKEKLPSELMNQAGSTSGVPTLAPSARRPVQRLDSLNKRTTRAASSSSSVPGASGSRPVGLKFQPKAAIRRSKEEREAQDRAEEERRAARLAEVGGDGYSIRGQYDRGGGRGGASRAGFRGGMSGWRSEKRGISQASGPLSGGPTMGEMIDKRGRGSRGRVSALGISSSEISVTGGSRVKKEPAFKTETEGNLEVTTSKSSFGKMNVPKIKDENQNPTYVSSEGGSDNEKGPRINIEHINLVSEEETDDDTITTKAKGRLKTLKPPGWATRPIRLDRHEHMERTIGVNTNASSLTSAELRRRAIERGEAEGSLFLPEEFEEEATKKSQRKTKTKSKDVEFVRDERKWKGVYQDEEDREDNVKVKEEPKEDDDTMIIDVIEPPVVEIPVPDDIETFPESSTKRALKESKGDQVPASPQMKRKRKPGFRNMKPVLQTEEDRQEWERYETDGIALAEELGTIGLGLEPMPANKGSDANVSTEDTADEQQQDRKSDLVYLFQLPPIVPNLVNIDKPKELQNLDDSVKQIPPTAVTKGRAKVSVPEISAATAKKFDPIIKTEMEDDPMSLNDKIPNAMMAEDTDDFAGDLGTLTIYESGEATFSWGGIDHELGRGAEGELLQEAILLDYKWTDKDEMKDEVDANIQNAAVALGQVSGGFVVTPDWSSMFG